jgi:hypothetical protein
MKKFSSLIFTLFASLYAFIPAAQAYETDSNTVGYTDYGGASYYRDKCTSYFGNPAKVNGLSARSDGGYFKSSAASCAAGGHTPQRGNSSPYPRSHDLWCGNQSYAIDGMRGYSDANGVTKLGISCNNGSYSTDIAVWAGTVNGPYYNSVRCPSGNVAWGVWGSLGSTRVGRVGMVCNSWWP